MLAQRSAATVPPLQQVCRRELRARAHRRRQGRWRDRHPPAMVSGVDDRRARPAPPSLRRIFGADREGRAATLPGLAPSPVAGLDQRTQPPPSCSGAGRHSVGATPLTSGGSGDRAGIGSGGGAGGFGGGGAGRAVGSRSGASVGSLERSGRFCGLHATQLNATKVTATTSDFCTSSLPLPGLHRLDEERRGPRRLVRRQVEVGVVHPLPQRRGVRELIVDAVAGEWLREPLPVSR